MGESLIPEFQVPCRIEAEKESDGHGRCDGGGDMGRSGQKMDRGQERA